MQGVVEEALEQYRQRGRNREKDGFKQGVGEKERKRKTRMCVCEMKKSDRGRGRNRLKREDNDEETIRNKEKETELELACCVYRSQMSGGNCAEGLFRRHLAAQSSVFFHKDTLTNPSEELHIIPLDALLKACNLG